MRLTNSEFKIVNKIEDDYGRTFRTLRVSLTDSCNLSCTYCVSEEESKRTISSTCSNSKKLSKDDYLEQILRIHSLTSLEVVRLTGGEPLLFKDIVSLVEGLKKAGIPKVKITTNGYLLKELASDLKAAGIDSLNISLDALDESVFRSMSRRKNVNRVIESIDEAVRLSIPVKINTVVMKGVNESEIVPLLKFSGERGIVIRYLELMNMGHVTSAHSSFFYSEKEILEAIGKEFKITALPRKAGATARYWVAANCAEFGIISNISHPFCSDCDRLRMDSTGKIYGCLSNDKGISIINAEEDLEAQLRKALAQKQMQFSGSYISMKSIGG